jgi:hypothetical protein
VEEKRGMKQVLVYASLVGLGILLSAGGAALSREAPAPGGEPQGASAGARFFEAKIRPLLAAKCFGCHGPQKQSGGLRLDSLAGVRQGGTSGPPVTPGHPEKSLLIELVHPESGRMPPTGKLKAEDVAALVQWVKLGAPWGVEQAGGSAHSGFRDPRSAEAKAWWAFRPVRRPPVPAVPGDRWSRNPVDRFIYRRLKAENLTPAPEAGPETLIRRVYFDLTGLPPAPEEVAAFVKECEAERASGVRPRALGERTSTPGTARAGRLNTRTPENLNTRKAGEDARAPGAYERLVDRLLASPRYGERMARHWLDLVRYADSDGYRADEYRPNAWRYRDYVIQAFNEDKPYDRFVQEQLAGDELFPGNPEALIATGYLRHWIYEWNQRDVRGQWTTILNDVTDTTGDVFLGLGLQCARCHDHKFDPILQKDYYRLQAFFAPILPRDDLVAATEAEKREYRTRLAAWEAKTAEIRRQIEEIEVRYRQKAEKGAVEIFPPDIQEMIRKPAAERAPLEHQLAELAFRQVLYAWDRLDQQLKGEDKEKVLALRKQLAAFDKEKPEPLPAAFAATDVGPAAPLVSIPKRGDQPVEPGFLTVLDAAPARIQPLPGAPRSTGRRAALARWLTRPDNPLTARIIVNRVWQWHFGRGLAANASDFGLLGARPTHPELLEWLAATLSAPAATRGVDRGIEGQRDGEKGSLPAVSPSLRLSVSQSLRPAVSPFLRRPGEEGLGWSLKRLHRLIVTSAAYRQASRHPRAAAFQVKDPENRLYWRGSARRLDAEQIRDAVLAVTGELDLKEGGPGVPGTEPRRTIYTRYMRNTRDPLLDVFDLPEFFVSAASRDTTTTPVQSLLLFNSQPLLLRAKALAARLERDAPGGEAEAIERAYRLAYGRSPAADELTAARQFLREQSRRVRPEEAGSEAAAFLHDRIPYRDGQAALFSPEGPQRRFEVPYHAMLPEGDFTIEAFVLPRSVYESGAVRTIAARWDGGGKSPGWGFGITGKQSRRKPQTLVMQLIGSRLDGSSGEEAIFSDQHIQINKPYYAAASVKLAAGGQPGVVTFYLKDLSNDDEPLLVARVPHRITGGFGNTLPLTLGGRRGPGDSFFHGLIDDVRLSRAPLEANELLYTAEGAGPETVAYWQFEAKPDVFHDSAGNKLHIRPPDRNRGSVDPRREALGDFCHALLNSSEFLYVD